MKKILNVLFVFAGIVFFCGCDSQTAKSPEKSAAVKKSSAKFEWLTDFEKAKSRAKAENKVILLSFSGSDWCGWCIKLDQEVFSTPEFKDWAAENVIPVMADFPARKDLPPEQKMQNEKLRDSYNVAGYPTVLLLKSDGTVIAKTGYQRGGVKKYISHLKVFIGAAK